MDNIRSAGSSPNIWVSRIYAVFSQNRSPQNIHYFVGKLSTQVSMLLNVFFFAIQSCSYLPKNAGFHACFCHKKCQIHYSTKALKDSFAVPEKPPSSSTLSHKMTVVKDGWSYMWPWCCGKQTLQTQTCKLVVTKSLCHFPPDWDTSHQIWKRCIFCFKWQLSNIYLVALACEIVA